MKKSYFFLIFLIVILPSCVSKYENSMLKDANLRGSVKSIEETYYDIQYTNKKVEKKAIERIITYYYNTDGILLSAIYSAPSNDSYQVKSTEIKGDTLITMTYYYGDLEDDIDYVILNNNFQKIEEYTINRTNGEKKLWKKYTYKDGKIDRRYYGNELGFSQYVYDSNGYLTKIDVYDSNDNFNFTSYKYENDSEGRHIKTIMRLGAGSSYRENILIENYNEYGDCTYSKFNDWWEWRYKYTYDKKGNWITSLRKSNDSYEYKERKIVYY